MLFPFCHEETEYAVNLLFLCKISWSLWLRFAYYWNISLVFLENVETVLSLWHDACPNSSKESIWFFIPFAILWSLWLLRNDLIFKGEDRRYPLTIFYSLSSCFLIQSQVSRLLYLFRRFHG
ncbi:hypothetical protein GQ457_05G019770 [Hibiscus cannabinus]